MAGDAELRCRLGEANRQRCLERYTLERMASGKIARRKIRDAHPELAADAQPVG